MRSLLTPRWLLAHLLIVVISASFVALGLWQLSRHREQSEANALIEERLARQPRELRALLAEYPDEPASLAYRPVTATGTFEQDHELLLRSRSRGGEPGWHVLTPLRLPDDRALLVDRGWVPFELDELPVVAAPPPSGPVRVTGRVMLEQDPPQGRLAALAPRDRAEGPLARAFYVDIDRLAEQMPWRLEPVYVELTSLEPPQPSRLPLMPEPPSLSAGSHLSYSLQWFSFAVIVIVGYSLLARRELLAKDESESAAAH